MKPATSNSESGRIFDQLARSRRSIRGFLPEPVDSMLLEQIFETAAFAPSNCNTQPWQSHVVSGEMRDRLSHIFMETIARENTHWIIPTTPSTKGFIASASSMSVSCFTRRLALPAKTRRVNARHSCAISNFSARRMRYLFLCRDGVAFVKPVTSVCMRKT